MSRSLTPILLVIITGGLVFMLFRTFNTIKMYTAPFTVYASKETKKVDAGKKEDAADDPAIWYNREDPEASVIFGTNKNEGIYAFDLEGEKLEVYPIGKVNNIDIRYDFPLNGKSIDILAGTNRSDNSICFFEIEEGKLKEINYNTIYSSVGEVYGFCFYHSRKSGKYYANLSGRRGEFEQWELLSTDSGVSGRLVRSFNTGGMSEGMVCHDDSAWLYIASQDKGIWKYGAEPATGKERKRISKRSRFSDYMSYDIEGLAIYKSREGYDYLLASVQGNNSFAIYSIKGEHNYLTSFSVGDSLIDGCLNTDGIEVCSTPLGAEYPLGIFVAQDGKNYSSKGNRKSQNFKIVNWEDIAIYLSPVHNHSPFTVKHPRRN